MLPFKLSDSFVSGYKNKIVPWGFRDSGGNSLGEITFLRTYSRKKEDGTKETWVEVCRRVIEGMFHIQKTHCKANCLPWSNAKAQKSAQEAFDRLFNLKWTPPGRGLWMMGTPLIMEKRNSAPLQNCGFVSTKGMTPDHPEAPFTFLMEASMLGIGIGFDTKGAADNHPIHVPNGSLGYTIPDTREGWVISVGKLLRAFLLGESLPIFDYSEIRPEGAPIKTFGGTASGPAPLIDLHQRLTTLLMGRVGSTLSSVDIADIGNLIGVCVVSGNVRRSAELLMGSIEDQDFLDLKNPDIFPTRNQYPGGWGWMSNNSVDAEVGQDLSAITDGIALNGEPGVIWMDMTKAYGRLADPPDNKDFRAAGYNPCAEQSLESYELCTLVETFINRHDSLEDFQRTLKFAYLYAKTVTLLPTHWPQTNAIMQRNRRIGTSISGQANFVDAQGYPMLREWLDKSYATIKNYDNVYSEWLGIRNSIKVTTVKPSGTVSILAGESPGVHWSPGGKFFTRTIRFANTDPLLQALKDAGYRVEPESNNPETTSVAYFEVMSGARRSEKNVSIYEKAHIAAMAQRWWSDNSVSVTVSFDPETEGKLIPAILGMFEGQLKTVSFLPMGNFTYPQMPYAESSGEAWASYPVKKIDFSSVYGVDSTDAVGEKFCTTDTCMIGA